MPQIDVTRPMINPRLASSFQVERRVELIGQNGRNSMTVTTMNAIGVVAASQPSSLERREDGQFMSQAISITTKFRLQGPSEGFQADVVRWAGDRYVVTDVQDFVSYGPGFVVASAVSMDTMDQPPSSL